MFEPLKPRCWQVFDFLSAHKESLDDEEFLTQFLAPHCVFKRLGMRGSHLRIIQLPRELARFLIFMKENSVTSYLEIGTSSGGSWFLIDSYLRAVNSRFERSVGVNSVAKLRDWEQYRMRFPHCEFRPKKSTDLDLTGEFYDMVFIDATHKEHCVRQDFEKVREKARFVAFHDIVLRNSTVDRFWAKQRTVLPMWEFIDRSLPETCGIGVVATGGVPNADPVCHTT